jgi:hypothetical protein
VCVRSILAVHVKLILKRYPRHLNFYELFKLLRLFKIVLHLLLLQHFLHFLRLRIFHIDLFLHRDRYLRLIQIFFLLFQHLAYFDLIGTHIFNLNLSGDEFSTPLALIAFLKEIVQRSS